MIDLAFIVVIVIAAAVAGRAAWPTHLSAPIVPQHPDRSTGRWLRECELILASGSGKHRAPSRIGGWAR